VEGIPAGLAGGGGIILDHPTVLQDKEAFEHKDSSTQNNYRPILLRKEMFYYLRKTERILFILLQQFCFKV